jgi:hypothetical protein
MFNKRKARRDGGQAEALVLEKKIYAATTEGGRTNACRYQLRVKFEDGSTTEISRRVFGYTLASAGVGDIVPVRYDPPTGRKSSSTTMQLLSETRRRRATGRPRRSRGAKSSWVWPRR